MASSESLENTVDEFNEITIEGQEEQSFYQFDGLSIATAAHLATEEVPNPVLAMEGDGEGNFGLFGGEAPKTLDDLVDMLDIGETFGTAVSPDIQHFSAFATDDMWPV